MVGCGKRKGGNRGRNRHMRPREGSAGTCRGPFRPLSFGPHPLRHFPFPFTVMVMVTVTVTVTVPVPFVFCGSLGKWDGF
jgi:hypothetical protein